MTYRGPPSRRRRKGAYCPTQFTRENLAKKILMLIVKLCLIISWKVSAIECQAESATLMWLVVTMAADYGRCCFCWPASYTHLIRVVLTTGQSWISTFWWKVTPKFLNMMMLLSYTAQGIPLFVEIISNSCHYFICNAWNETNHSFRVFWNIWLAGYWSFPRKLQSLANDAKAWKVYQEEGNICRPTYLTYSFLKIRAFAETKG